MSRACGGARSWLGRREDAVRDDDWFNHELDLISNHSSPEEEEDVVLSCEVGVGPVSKRFKVAPLREHDGCSQLMSKGMYEAVRDTLSGQQSVTRATGDSILRRDATAGVYLGYEAVELDEQALELAGHLPELVGHSSLLGVHHAEVLTEAACPLRCGDACTDSCRVRAFVHTAGHGTDYFFGSHMDVVQALSAGSVGGVYIWDQVEHLSMKRLKSYLEQFMQERMAGLAMKATALKTVPGQYLYHCNIETWAKFCLEHPLAELDLRFRRLEEINSAGEVTGRAYGAPSTSRWQEAMEDTFAPTGLPLDTDIVGMMHALDISHVSKDGSRKGYPFYGAPAGLGEKLRGHTDVWPPVAYLPI